MNLTDAIWYKAMFGGSSGGSSGDSAIKMVKFPTLEEAADLPALDVTSIFGYTMYKVSDLVPTLTEMTGGLQLTVASNRGITYKLSEEDETLMLSEGILAVISNENTIIAIVMTEEMNAIFESQGFAVHGAGLYCVPQSSDLATWYILWGF